MHSGMLQLQHQQLLKFLLANETWAHRSKLLLLDFENRKQQLLDLYHQMGNIAEKIRDCW